MQNNTTLTLISFLFWVSWQVCEYFQWIRARLQELKEKEVSTQTIIFTVLLETLQKNTSQYDLRAHWFSDCEKDSIITVCPGE